MSEAIYSPEPAAGSIHIELTLWSLNTLRVRDLVDIFDDSGAGKRRRKRLWEIRVGGAREIQSARNGALGLGFH